MISYLLKSAACLALSLLFYHLILEKEKMHQFNRFYLLIGVLTSFLIPLITITIPTESMLVIPQETTFTPIQTTPVITSESVGNPVDYTIIWISLYLTISVLFFVRFGLNLNKILRKVYINKKITYQKATLVLVDDAILPHTFWKYIFINKDDYFNEQIEQELFTHELTHATQKHTIDVLLIEFLQIIFWLNPLFIFIKKAIQLNHEYLADENVIHQHKNTFQYQHLLLNKAAWKNEYYLASNLNYLVTKKRLKMMTTQSSPLKILLKKLAVIPLLTGFTILFAEKVEAQKVIEVINEKPQLQETRKIEKSHIQTIEEQITTRKGDKIKTGFIIINGNNYYYVKIENTVKFYNKNGKLSDKNGNQISNEKANASEIIPDRHVKKVYYKGVVFCEFIDDKSKNEKEQFKGIEELEQLVEKENKVYSLKKYLKINELYEFSRQQKPHYVKSDKKRQEKLEEQFSLLGTLYFKLSKNDKKKVNRPIHPHDPYLKLMKNNKIFYKLRSELTEEDKLLIPPPPPVPNATKEEVLKAKKAYKEWEKRTGNKIPPPPPISPLDEIIKMAKNGAQFYFENKEISSDKAIELLKKNKGLNIHSESTDFNAYKVWISKKKINKNNALGNFDIKMSKNSDKITLTCSSGCKWNNLEFTLNDGKNQMIDEFGMTKVNRKKSSFVFDVSYKSNRVTLKGYKGTAWKELGFTIRNYSKIDQFGVKTH